MYMRGQMYSKSNEFIKPGEMLSLALRAVSPQLGAWTDIFRIGQKAYIEAARKKSEKVALKTTQALTVAEQAKAQAAIEEARAKAQAAAEEARARIAEAQGRVEEKKVSMGSKIPVWVWPTVVGGGVLLVIAIAKGRK
jgi:uncharacterized protein YqfA (UPF0365 family)